MRPRLSRPISRIFRKLTTDPSPITRERSTFTTPLNGALGIGVTKISCAEAFGTSMPTASRNAKQIAVKENRQCISGLRRLSYANVLTRKEYTATQAAATKLAAISLQK